MLLEKIIDAVSKLNEQTTNILKSVTFPQNFIRIRVENTRDTILWIGVGSIDTHEVLEQKLREKIHIELPDIADNKIFVTQKGVVNQFGDDLIFGGKHIPNMTVEEAKLALKKKLAHKKGFAGIGIQYKKDGQDNLVVNVQEGADLSADIPKSFEGFDVTTQTVPQAYFQTD